MNFFIYLLVTAGVTYLIRMLPLVLMKKKITNRFILSFLHYIPYSVLAVMTIPAIFYATDFIPAIAGFLIAVVLAFKGKSLLTVAAAACSAVLVVTLLQTYLF